MLLDDAIQMGIHTAITMDGPFSTTEHRRAYQITEIKGRVLIYSPLDGKEIRVGDRIAEKVALQLADDELNTVIMQNSRRGPN
jgi:hypothetical protein